MDDREKYCFDCSAPKRHHWRTWVDCFAEFILPDINLSSKLDRFFDLLLEKFMVSVGLGRYTYDYTEADIQPRSYHFLEEMKRRGARCSVIRTAFGCTNHFRIEMNGKEFRFDMLPAADFLSKVPSKLIDDKERTKILCRKNGFPVPDGGAYWFWQKKKAIDEGMNKIGFPLVAKPRGGSVSRHVATNINSREELTRGIAKALEYSPMFIVERCMAGKSVFRATVIDFDKVFCLRQVPANVTGDGTATIKELIEKKNADPRRGSPKEKHFILNKIVVNSACEEFLAKSGLTLDSIPASGATVILHKDPFIKLGGELVEESALVHPANAKLFRDIAKFFDIRLTGIDFMAKDIAVSWKDQECAMLELNHVPCIDLHMFPYAGPPADPAKALADMFEKYYLKQK